MNNVTRRPLLNRSLPRLGTTIFAEMSARSVATGSLNLGQGFPDRDGPASVARAAADAIHWPDAATSTRPALASPNSARPLTPGNARCSR
jgi:aspartate/methionine/tyrosine aminotransferase